jgi:hypothetical protein
MRLGAGIHEGHRSLMLTRRLGVTDRSAGLVTLPPMAGEPNSPIAICRHRPPRYRWVVELYADLWAAPSPLSISAASTSTRTWPPRSPRWLATSSLTLVTTIAAAAETEHAGRTPSDVPLRRLAGRPKSSSSAPTGSARLTDCCSERMPCRRDHGH